MGTLTDRDGLVHLNSSSFHRTLTERDGLVRLNSSSFHRTLTERDGLVHLNSSSFHRTLTERDGLVHLNSCGSHRTLTERDGLVRLNSSSFHRTLTERDGLVHLTSSVSCISSKDFKYEVRYSPCVCGSARTQTPDLGMMRRVFYHYAPAAVQNWIKLCTDSYAGMFLCSLHAP
jgi:hypothetical protein